LQNVQLVHLVPTVHSFVTVLTLTFAITWTGSVVLAHVRMDGVVLRANDVSGPSFLLTLSDIFWQANLLVVGCIRKVNHGLQVKHDEWRLVKYIGPLVSVYQPYLRPPRPGRCIGPHVDAILLFCGQFFGFFPGSVHVLHVSSDDVHPVFSWSFRLCLLAIQFLLY